MKGSFQIIKILGIPLKLHWTFGLMLLWIVFEGRRNGMSWEGVGWFGVLIFGLFICVVLHELGHALSARKYGVTTKDIILSPIGGVARLDSLPEKPIHESVVAAAGPFVNLLLAAIFGAYGWITSSIDFTNLGGSKMMFGNPDNFVTLFFLINIFLAIFNLIPAFPMDGGRIFRSLLSVHLGRRRATLVTSYFGQGLAVLVIVVSYYFLPERMMIYLIPLFALMGAGMFYMASQEYRMVKFEEILKTHQVSELIRLNFTIFQDNDKIALAVETLKHGLEKDFLVKNKLSQIVGVISEPEILEVAKSIPIEAYENHELEEFISPINNFAEVNDTLHDFYKKLVNQQLRILPVFENKELIGVVDIQQLNDFLKIKYELS